MGKRLQEKWELMKNDRESLIFSVLLFAAALYYGWRLFALTPWYDELYTYYYFISRGPVYAAIHWPLPNNHVGYSVLSALLDIFGNAAIGLRGVSWICSLCSLYLLFAIGRKCLPKGFALVPVFLYSSMELVTTLAVQGRGYALASCLYLLALYELIQITVCHEQRIQNYCILAAAFIWALYTLPSSVYFVIPLCVTGGTWLLVEKRGKEFGRLFVTALISAVCTIGLYAIIWLAIGSNLLSKTPDSGCYGQGHISIILNAPFKALRTGIRYMLDTPYIQSVPREGYLPRFGAWIKVLFEYYYSGLSTLLEVLVMIGIVVMAVKVFRGINKKTGLEKNPKQENMHIFLEWYLLLSFLLTPVMLILQAALPYYRVFSYFGIPVALLLTELLTKVVSVCRKQALIYGLNVLTAVFCIVMLSSPFGREPYSDRETAIEDVYTHVDPDKGKVVCVTDCDQEYLMKYLYDREDVSYVPQEADYVLLDKLLQLSAEEFDETDSGDYWKFYIYNEEIPWDYLEKEMDICYENDRFVMYQRKTE